MRLLAAGGDFDNDHGVGDAHSSGAEQAVVFACEDCGAELRVEAHLRTTRCPYCDAPSVVERPPRGSQSDPVFVIGFVLQDEQAKETARRWLGSRSRFARSGLARATIEELRGIYTPVYLYRATADVTYRAEIGERYTAHETYRDANGNTQTRVRTRTEWHPLSGRYSCYVKDRLVTASRGLSNRELESLEPFDLRAIHRYTPAMISGWLAEEPSLEVDRCLALAHKESIRWIEDSLAGFMPGDAHRSLEHETELRNERCELIMVPIWVCAARYHPTKPPMRVVLNGQTGAINGTVPYSWLKIGTAIILAIVILVAFVGYLSVRSG